MINKKNENDKNPSELLGKNKLCKECINHYLFGDDIDISPEIVESIKNEHRLSSDEHYNCWLCEGLYSELKHFEDLIIEKLKDYEFETFLVGLKVDEDILKREKKFLDFFEIPNSFSIKNYMKRKIGLKMEGFLGKLVDFKNPDIMVVLDTMFDVVSLQIKPVYIYGRYKKFKRGLPQTRWFCRICRGVGCKRCDYTGVLYDSSVEDLISAKIIELFKGESASFHGCGREDIDVKMLGNGRPFVIEIENPRLRTYKLEELQKEINNYCEGKVEIVNLRFCDKSEVVRLKEANFRKVYRVVFNAEGSIDIEKLKKAVQCLQASKVKQKTPSRVAHRRADLIREKHVYNCEIERLDGSVAILKLETQSGTYIKEVVSGDDGRTQPNISDLIGVPCKVSKLDVLEIKGE